VWIATIRLQLFSGMPRRIVFWETQRRRRRREEEEDLEERA
jgi:hypothetical protein